MQNSSRKPQCEMSLRCLKPSHAADMPPGDFIHQLIAPRRSRHTDTHSSSDNADARVNSRRDTIIILPPAREQAARRRLAGSHTRSFVQDSAHFMAPLSIFRLVVMLMAAYFHFADYAP